LSENVGDEFVMASGFVSSPASRIFAFKVGMKKE